MSIRDRDIDTEDLDIDLTELDDIRLDEGDDSDHPRRKKHHPIRSLLKLVIVLLIVVFGAYSVLAWHYIGMVNIVEEGDRVNVSGELIDSKSVRSILLIGTDARSVSDSGRSDTVMLLSVNYKSKEIILTSFMRDAYVEIPGHDKNKLNAAYRWGGADLLMDTLELNFNVKIDDYVFVNFESFANIVDAVGGIELTVTDAEAKGMQAPMAEVNKLNGVPQKTDFLYSGGTYNMNGNQALGYARLRYVGNADFQRTERQREVVKKIFAKAKTLSIKELDEFASVCAESVTTNMTKGEMYKLSLQMLYFMSFDVTELRIPADDCYKGGTTSSGQSVLMIDFDANIEKIKDTVFKKALN